jgi:hypothetical protein
MIGRAMNGIGPGGMWETKRTAFITTSFASVAALRRHAIDKWQRERVPGLVQIMVERTRRMPELLESIHSTGPGHFGVAERGILGLVNQDRLRRILTRMLDENEFLSPYGIRSLSRYHADHRYVFSASGREYRVSYLPAESDSGMFGGNSNWRGPIWGCRSTR